MLTKEKLINSNIFKDNITGRVSLIHNIWGEYAEPVYIVLQSNMGKWSITKFYKENNIICVNLDHENLSTEETFKILLAEYSCTF